MNCWTCGAEIEDGFYCDPCRAKWPKPMGAPAIHGCSTGPGSYENEMVYDRPDKAKEVRLTLQKMEAAGQLNDPQTRRYAEIYYDGVKNMKPEKLDYQKGDHPLDS